MSSDKKIFDDLARMAGGAVNVMSGLQQQVRDDVRSRFDEFSSRLDLIARHEFDELHSLVGRLTAKIAELEKAGTHKSAGAKKKTKAKARPVAKKAAKAATGAKRKVATQTKAVKKSVKKKTR